MSETEKAVEMNEVKETQILMPDSGGLVVSSSPHIHLKSQEIWKVMLWVVVSLLPTSIAGVWFFGIDALKVIVLCVVFCMMFEAIWCRLAGNPVFGTLKDLSAVVT